MIGVGESPGGSFLLENLGVELLTPKEMDGGEVLVWLNKFAQNLILVGFI